MATFIDVYINLDDFQETQHPRAKSGSNAGQFVKKGQEGGTQYEVKGKNKFRLEGGIPYSNSPTEGRKTVHKLATSAEADKDPHAVAKKIIEHTANFTTFAHYSNKVLRAMEQKYGLKKESLGIAANKGSGYVLPKQSAVQPKAEEPKPQPTPEPPKEEPKPEPPKEEPKAEESKKELPQPHASSASQKQMHEAATSEGTTEEKVAKIQAINAPTHFAEEYKAKLLEAVSPGTKPVQSTPAAAPAASAVTTTTPTKPPASWHAGMKVLEGGVRSTSSSWDEEKASQAMATTKNAWWNKIPAEQKAACKMYVGSSSSINEALRNPDAADKYTIEAIHNIDAAFEHPEARTKEDMVVYRGMPLNTYGGGQTLPIEKLKKALKLGLPAAFQWDGFVSTSFADKAAFSNSSVQVEIGVPKGSPALSFGGSIGYKSEKEVLLPHGRAFQVLSIEELGNEKYRVKVVMK